MTIMSSKESTTSSQKVIMGPCRAYNRYLHLTCTLNMKTH
jgi:hypothetical protein